MVHGSMSARRIHKRALRANVRRQTVDEPNKPQDQKRSKHGAGIVICGSERMWFAPDNTMEILHVWYKEPSVTNQINLGDNHKKPALTFGSHVLHLWSRHVNQRFSRMDGDRSASAFKDPTGE